MISKIFPCSIVFYTWNTTVFIFIFGFLISPCLALERSAVCVFFTYWINYLSVNGWQNCEHGIYSCTANSVFGKNKETKEKNSASSSTVCLTMPHKSADGYFYNRGLDKKEANNFEKWMDLMVEKKCSNYCILFRVFCLRNNFRDITVRISIDIYKHN